MGNKDEARKQYHLALEADPNHTAAHYNYGNICILFKFNVYNPR
jgi:Tfp pilus assembly protein PilF